MRIDSDDVIILTPPLDTDQLQGSPTEQGVLICPVCKRRLDLTETAIERMSGTEQYAFPCSACTVHLVLFPHEDTFAIAPLPVARIQRERCRCDVCASGGDFKKWIATFVTPKDGTPWGRLLIESVNLDECASLARGWRGEGTGDPILAALFKELSDTYRRVHEHIQNRLQQRP